MQTVDFHELADRVLAGQVPTREELREVLAVDDEELMVLLAATRRVREARYGNRVKLQVLVNARSGHCGEDCGYCSQSKVADTPIQRYPLLDENELYARAKEAHARGATRFCMVTAGRGPTERDIERLSAAARRIARDFPLELCCSVGFVNEAQVRRLGDAGVSWINHNLNTNEARYGEICGTHTYADRVNTVRTVQQAGLKSCCGGIVGLGETDEDLIDLAFAFRELGVDSIPINFFHPGEGIPLKPDGSLDEGRCLRALCLVRLVNPEAEVRMAGGRELHLREQQGLGLYAANALFIEGYLTTPGAGADETVKMIGRYGFEVERVAPTVPPELLVSGSVETTTALTP
ncbi:MAG: biotin synthase BioB [Deltaproteobacteria bacterium]|nr:biotin synthase BioB [Deltaproteobacteria bacterium]